MKVADSLISSFQRSFSLPRTLLLYLVIGIVVRLAIAPWTSHPNDMFAFYDAEMGIFAGIGPYGNAVYSYPPLFAVIAFPFVYLASLFVDPSTFISFQAGLVDVSHMTGMLTPYVTSPLFNLMVKLPGIIVDVLTGIVIYNFVKNRKGEDAAGKLFIIWILNPLVIFVTAVHGQFDVIPAFLTIMAVILFIEKDYLLSGLVLGLGVLFKIYPIYIIILLFLILSLPLFTERYGPEIRKILRRTSSFVVGIVLSLVTLAPFVISSGNFLDFILRRGTYTSFGGINLWFIKSGFEAEGLEVHSVQGVVNFLPTLLLALTIILVISFSVWVVRSNRGTKDLSDETIIKGVTVLLAIVLLTSSVTNPQYLLWIFPFLLLLSVWDDRMPLKFAILTVVGLLFYFSLQSFEAFCYPLASFTGIGSVEEMSSHIADFYDGGGMLNRHWLIAAVGGVGALALLTIVLPRKYDPLDWMSRKVIGWRR
jgi:Gpi18-like mannosyltransferase